MWSTADRSSTGVVTDCEERLGFGYDDLTTIARFQPRRDYSTLCGGNKLLCGNAAITGDRSPNDGSDHAYYGGGDTWCSGGHTVMVYGNCAESIFSTFYIVFAKLFSRPRTLYSSKQEVMAPIKGKS